MFWNKKKNEESEEDLYELSEEELDDIADEDDADESADELDGNDDANVEEELDENDDANVEEELDGEMTEGDDLDGDGFFDESGEAEQEDTSAITVSVKVGSLNSLAEFISLRHPLNLQFMKKDSEEVFELRESHFRLARVFGSVSMYRECSAEEYAKIALAMELLEKPDDFYVLPALTDSDIKAAMTEFCEEKYGDKSKKYAKNPKKFAKLLEENGDKDEWNLFLKEVLYKKTEDFCNENGIEFSEEDGEENDE